MTIARDNDGASNTTLHPIQTQHRAMYLIYKEDQIYEQDILRDPISIGPWLRYIDYKCQQGSLLDQVFIFERACHCLPRSYKIWKMYLDLRVKHLRDRNAATHSSDFLKVNSIFEKALVLLNKMPKIWLMYLSLLMRQPQVTTTRSVFDRALRALPITQHSHIWALFKSFATSAQGLTAINLWKRYMQVCPEGREDFVDMLVEQSKYNEAVKVYLDILDNRKFYSQRGRSRFQIWSEMAELMVSKAREIEFHFLSTDIDAVFRSGIQTFADQRGRLWTALATYWITRTNFDKARDTFEEGITSVMTVRDFTVIFDAYVEFEESMISFLMDEAADRSTRSIADEGADTDLDIYMMRFEHLMDRRPFLVNDVLLRQNTNNVNEWAKRVALWGSNRKEVAKTYDAALRSIQPKKAIGKLYEMWLDHAKFYEKAGDLDSARIILQKAVKVHFKSVNELAETWCGWAELELRNQNFDSAVKVMEKATSAPKRSLVDYFDDTLSPQQRVHKSWKLWSFYVDLVESVCPLEETRKVYDRIFELRIATPQTVVNYANLLEENEYFEDSFKIYERGLDLFKYPVAYEIWNLYLTKAVDRKISIERLRDLFEQAVEGCPPRFAKSLYLMYGKLEENRGLARHAMRIYERATRAVSDVDRASMFNFYIAQSATNFGLTSARPIYQRAIEVLPDREAKDMCLKFAEMERKLGEIDRARAIFGHGSQFCDPRTVPTYWQKWENFEIQHGNEDTFKEMLRVKRSVQAHYNTDVSFIASQALERSQHVGLQELARGEVNSQSGVPPTKADAMAELERQAMAPLGFVAASSGPEGSKPMAEKSFQSNPNAIDIGNEEDA